MAGESSAVSANQEGKFGAKSEKSLARMQSRNASSKYDFVKVKVWLGENADHYYVLSRFLLSRMLTVTKIPNHVAIKIALELKKLLIDNSLLDVSQTDLEANLFKLMERRGYGKEYIDRYKMMTKFHHQRVPLVILVCGTACTGKSTIATQLAQRLNLPNVLQTDMVYELLRTSTDAPLTSVPVWARGFSTPEEMITEFCRECRIVWKGLAGDLKKAMKDGKPIIIEGVHLDPSIYLMNEENRGSLGLPVTNNLDSSQKTPEKISLTPIEQNRCDSISERDIEDSGSTDQLSDKEKSRASRGEISCPASVSDKKSDLSGEIQKNRYHNVESHVRKGKYSSEPILVPIVLKMAEFDHKALLEEWTASRTHGEKHLMQLVLKHSLSNSEFNTHSQNLFLMHGVNPLWICKSFTYLLIKASSTVLKWIDSNSIYKTTKDVLLWDRDNLIRNLKTIQDYLCSFEAQGLMVVNISATTFPQTLDQLHNYLLQCIEEGVSSSSEGQ